MPGHVTSAPPLQPSGIERLAAHCARLEDHGLSFSLLVAQGDDVLLDRAHGFADHATRRPLATTTVLGTASLAKQLTATAVLRLASEGALRLDDPVTQHLVEAPPAFAGITIDHLLAHTSGIVDDYDLYATSPDLPRARWLERLFARELDGRPGEAWRYANDGYSLLALVVERTSGRPFRRYVHDTLFRPAGMERTGFAGEPHLSDAADGWGGEEPRAPLLDRWAGGLGASDVWSTPRDLWAWERAMRRHLVLAPEWSARLYEPQVEVFDGFSYARGWWVRRSERGTKVVFHSGREDDGFNAWYARFVDEDVTAIFASNMSVEVHPLREALFGGRLSTVEVLLFGDGGVAQPPAAATPARPCRELEGTYRLDDGSTLAVRDRDPWLEVTPHGQAAFELLLPDEVGAGERAALRETTLRTEALLAALAAGDEGPFRAAVGERDDLFVVPVPVLGPYEVLGTHPLRRASATSLVATTYVRTAAGIRRFQWSGATLARHHSNRAPVVPLFRAISATGWANWLPFLEAAGRIDLGEPHWASRRSPDVPPR